MNMGLFFRISLLILIVVSLTAQDPVNKNQLEVDLQTEFIVAMQSMVLEKYDDALDKFQKLKAKVKNDGIVEFEMAKIYNKQGKTEDAIYYARKAIQKDDSKHIYKQFLIDLYKKIKDYGQAAMLLESELNKDYFNSEDFYRTADYYVKAHNEDKAIEVLDRLEKFTDDDLNVELYKSQIYLRNRDYKKALKLVKKLTKKYPDNTKVLLRKALVLRLMNDEDGALKVYEKVLSLDPANPGALSYISAMKRFDSNEAKYVDGMMKIIQNEDMDLDKKIKVLIPFVSKVSKTGALSKSMLKVTSELVKLYPERAEACTLYADVLNNSGKTDESIKYYKKAIELNKNNFEIWKQLMSLYTLKKKWKSLLELSEEAIEYYPNQALGYYYAARALVNMDKPGEALQYLDDAMDYAGNKPKLKNEILLLKAKCYISKNKAEKASKVLEEIDTATKEGHPFYWELKGDIEMLNGNNTKALEYWEKSSQLGNDTEELKEKIKNVRR